LRVHLSKFFLLLTGLGALALSACGGSAPQVSGIVAKVSLETTACLPLEKTLKIRNNDSTEPQRVQGVMFELGTNNDKYYKITAVTVGSSVKKVVGNLEEEVLLPPGGIMAVKVVYNPKKVTVGDELQSTYLDFVLNGPKLGVIQIELDGKAPQALQGCGTASENERVFQVVDATTTINDKDLNPNPAVTALDVSTQVKGDFRFNIDGEKVTMTTDGWPEIDLKPPDQPEVPVLLGEDSPEGSFKDGDLTIDGLTLSASGIAIPDVTLTTGSATASASDADGGQFSITGKKFDESTGEMTLVLAVPLTENAFQGTAIFNGVLAAEIHLKEKK
jgi:hypothetical protein